MRFVSIFLIITFLSCVSYTTLSAAPLYNQDGIRLNHAVTKYETIYSNNLKRNVVIWKSTFELINDNKKSIAVRVPCYLSYAYSYLNPYEISTIQQQIPEIQISNVYKNFVAVRPRMLNAKSTIISEKYFATLDNVDLRTAVINWDFKFSFWY